jgi:hypothetical protein
MLHFFGPGIAGRRRASRPAIRNRILTQWRIRLLTTIQRCRLLYSRPSHLSLIWFTVWSSVVHAGIMAAQSCVSPEQRGQRRKNIDRYLIETPHPRCGRACVGEQHGGRPIGGKSILLTGVQGRD